MRYHLKSQEALLFILIGESASLPKGIEILVNFLSSHGITELVVVRAWRKNLHFSPHQERWGKMPMQLAKELQK